jgi:hypothetical protein
MTSDYKKHSLEKIQEWVHDAMNSDVSPHEIYSAIREAVREDYYYHKDCISRAGELLKLLNDCRFDEGSVTFGPDIYHDEMIAAGYIISDGVWVHSNSLTKKDKVKKWVLPIEETKDADTDETEYFVSFPDDLLEAANLKKGDQVEWVDNGDGTYTIRHKTMSNTLEQKTLNYQEAIDAGYTMTADGFWLPPQDC